MQNLAELVAERGPLPVREAIGWTLRAAMTLWALHAEGMVHGRVRPAAILTAGPECRDDGFLTRPSLLEDDGVYHSPARAEGDGPSKQDDVWALGITLYFVLTGKLPYPRGIQAALEEGRLRMPPPLAVYSSALDVMQPVLDRIIRADRADRLTHIEDMVAGLRELSPSIADVAPLSIDQAFTEEDQVPAAKPRTAAQLALGSLAPPPPPTRREDANYATLMAVAGVVALGVAIFIAWPSSGGDAEGTPSSAVVSATVPRPSPSGPQASTSVAPAPPPVISVDPVYPSPEPRGQDLVACTSSFFAPDAFDAKRVNRDFPCAQTNPVDGVDMVTALLAQGSAGEASEAAREWSNLGWYRVAAYAVARSLCCDHGAPLKSAALFGVCDLDGALGELATAVMSGSDDDVGAVLKRYSTAAGCVGTAGGGPMFGFEGHHTPQQAAVFLRMVARVRASRRR